MILEILEDNEIKVLVSYPLSILALGCISEEYGKYWHQVNSSNLYHEIL